MTFDKVAELIAEYKGIDREAVREDSTFVELKLDSLDVADLAMSLEDEFDISIDLAPGVKTLADLVRVIDEAKGE